MLTGTNTSHIIADEISDNNILHRTLLTTGLTNASLTRWTDTSVLAYNRCVFCGSATNEEYDIICAGCYKELSDNIELLDDRIRQICESGGPGVVLKLNMIGILLKQREIIDSFDVAKGNINFCFLYRVNCNDQRTTLMNKITDSPTDIVPREMFMVD